MGFLYNILCGKTNRTGYVLSVLAVVLGFYYCDFSENLSDICYACKPPELFPWKDILFLFVATSLGSGYLCVIFSFYAYDTSWVQSSIIYLPILLTVFYYVQTIKRCHDIGCSGWRSLIPVYSPLFLFFIKGKNVNEQTNVKTSFVIELCEYVCIILFMIVLCVFYYMERAEYIHLHNSLHRIIL